MKKKVLVIGILVMLLGVTVIIKPKKEILIDITNENNKLALFVENEEGIYEEATTIPSSGYTLNTSRSGCNNGAKPSWNLSDNTLKISSLGKNSTSCYLYFRKANTTDKILANSKVNEGTPDFSKIADTDEGIYKAQDDDGTSYYFRGAVTNNYVKFANKFWRIIRINGDGTIRMIYDGDTPRENGTTFNAETSAFNSSSNNDNMYVGLKYTSGQVHGIGTESTILQTLNTWYANNLASYASMIDPNAGFCGDRTPYKDKDGVTIGGGTGATSTYYGGYIRLYTKKAPVLTCPVEDFYTVTGAKKGNKSLKHSIGLITADEVAMAGGVYGSGKANQNYYLYTGQTYWTLSPFYYVITNGYVGMLGVYSNGQINNDSVIDPWGVRSVINLRADLELTGTGTMTDPYVVVGGN